MTQLLAAYTCLHSGKRCNCRQCIFYLEQCLVHVLSGLFAHPLQISLMLTSMLVQVWLCWCACIFLPGFLSNSLSETISERGKNGSASKLTAA